MKLRHKSGWLATAVTISAAFLVGILTLGWPRPRPFHVGSKLSEVSSYVSFLESDEKHHPKRLPPFKHTFGQIGTGGTGVMLITSEFSLRSDHVFARRNVEVFFSTNGTVTGIGSRWKWSWNL